MGCLLTSVLVATTALAAAFLTQLWLDSKSYIFEQADVVAICEKAAGKWPLQSGHKKAFRHIEKELRLRYGPHILPNPEWIFVNAGGWMGSMYILHASLTEYLLFFGTALGSNGHSGRYWANISDTMVEGVYTRWPEGTTDTLTFHTGQTIYHVPGEVAAVHWSANTWMVEYGRGFVPSTLPFALADTIFSTTDYVTLYKTIKVYVLGLAYEFANTVLGT